MFAPFPGPCGVQRMSLYEHRMSFYESSWKQDESLMTRDSLAEVTFWEFGALATNPSRIRKAYNALFVYFILFFSYFLRFFVWDWGGTTSLPCSSVNTGCPVMWPHFEEWDHQEIWAGRRHSSRVWVDVELFFWLSLGNIECSWECREFGNPKRIMDEVSMTAALAGRRSFPFSWPKS